MSGLVLALIRLLGALRRVFEDSEFRALLLLMVSLLISGTLFYASHEGWNFVDALYFCVMTMSTIGYGDLTPTSSLSKIFTIIYSLISIGVFVGVASKLAAGMLSKKHKSSDKNY